MPVNALRGISVDDGHFLRLQVVQIISISIYVTTTFCLSCLALFQAVLFIIMQS